MLLRRVCSLLHVDEIQFRALFRIHLLLDFRATRLRGSARRRSQVTSFLISLIFYFLVGLFTAFSGLRLFNLFGFGFLTLSVSMVLVAMAIIIEFNEIIMNPEDGEILAHRPVDSRTYFWVKMANLLFYVTAFGLALNLPPAFVGLAYPGAPFYFPVVYLAVAWLAHATTAFAMVLLYSFLVRWLNYERLKDVLAYVQVVFSFVVFLGYQFLMRLMPQMHKTELSGLWLYLVPPAWFAGWIGLLTSPQFQFELFAALAVFLFVLVSGLAVRKLSLDYAQLTHKLSLSARIREEKSVAVENATREKSGPMRWFLRGPVELAGYLLISRYLRRNRNMRMRIFPAFAMPLAVMGMFILDGEIRDPFIDPNLSVFMSLLFLVYLAVFFHEIIPTSDHWQASWILHIAPVENYGQLYRGIMKALVLKYVTPYFVLIGVILATQMALLHAIYLTVLNYVIFIAYWLFMMIFMKDLPLSRKFERGRSNVRFILTLLILPFFAVIGGLEYLICKFPVLLGPALVFFLILLVLFGRISGEVLHRRFRKLEFLG